MEETKGWEWLLTGTVCLCMLTLVFWFVLNNPEPYGSHQQQLEMLFTRCTNQSPAYQAYKCGEILDWGGSLQGQILDATSTYK